MTTTSVAPTPPAVPGQPVIGALPAFLRDRIGFIRKAAERGTIVDLPLGPYSGTLVTHPDLIRTVLEDRHSSFLKAAAEGKEKGKAKELEGNALLPLLGDGLMTSSGDAWFAQRRVLQPAFHSEALNNTVDAMVRGIATSLDAFPLNGRTGIMRHAYHLMVEVVARTFFGTTDRQNTEEIRQAIDVAAGHLSKREFAPVRTPATWPTPANRRYQAAIEQLDVLVYALIAERRENSEPVEIGLLDLLIQARDEDTGEGMSDQLIRDQLVTMFVAGFEATVNTLTWAWALLGKYPELLAKVSAEADAVLGSRLPVAADVRRLTYTQMVVEETLRLYPPVWLMWRQAAESVEIGDYQIPAGRRVYLSQFVTQRLPAFWDAPDTFRPERFAPEQAAARPQYAWFPFGGGPRQCIGDVFAVTNVVLAISMMCQRAQMIRSSELPKPQALLTLKPSEEVWLYATPR